MSTRAPERSALEDFLAQAVVDDYAAVEPREDARPWFRRHWAAVPAVLLIGVIIAVAVASTRASDDERRATREALASRAPERARPGGRTNRGCYPRRWHDTQWPSLV